MTFPLNTSILTLSLPSSTNEDEREYLISDYFVSHPQYVLGDWCERPGSRGKPELSVRWPFAESVVEDVSSLLSDAARELTSVQDHRTSNPRDSVGDAALGDAARPAYSTPSPNGPEQAARDLYTLAKNALTCSQNSLDRATLLRQAQTSISSRHMTPIRLGIELLALADPTTGDPVDDVVLADRRSFPHGEELLDDPALRSLELVDRHTAPSGFPR